MKKYSEFSKKDSTDVLIDRALNAFIRTIGLDAEIVRLESVEGEKPDGSLKMRITSSGHFRDFRLIFISRLTGNDLFRFSFEKDALVGDELLVSTHVSQQQAEKLGKLNISFIDSLGNARIVAPPLYINFKGGMASPRELKEPVPRIFREAGLRIIFTLLCNPGLLGKSVREIAQISGASVGAVHWTLDDLKKRRYLKETRETGLVFINKRKLLEQWAIAYPVHLRPKLNIGFYRPASNIELTQDTDLNMYDACWSGKVGAAKVLGQQIQSRLKTIYYAGKSIEKLKTPLRIITAHTTSGDIEILKKFWRFGNTHLEKQSVAPTVLIYADLMNIGDSEAFKSAQDILNKHLLS